MKKFFISSLLIGAIAGFPLYIYDSGSLQISHILFFAASALFLTRRSIFKLFRNPNVFFFLFFAYVTLRQCIFLFETNNFEYQIFIFYAVYNWIIYSCFSSVSPQNAKFLYITIFKGLIISVIIASLGVIVYAYLNPLNVKGFRTIGTFNNPNQLGYYAVLLLSFVLLFKSAKMNLKIQYKIAIQILPFFSFFLSILSLSKAAIITMLLGVAYLTKKNLLISLSIVVIVCLFSLNILPVAQLHKLQVVNRLLTIGSQSDDSFEGRGYIGFEELGPLGLFFGTGEGSHLATYGIEIHSTIYNLLVSYGLIGVGLFIFFYFGLFRRALTNKIDLAISMALPMIYGLTHNGIRSTLFWLLLSMIYLMPYVQNEGIQGQQNRINGDHSSPQRLRAN